MEKNGEYIGEVLSLGSEGEGVINCEGVTAFVPFCLTGERVSFRAVKVAGGVAYGKLTEVHTPSPERVDPVCPHFTRCGGCQLQHASYSCQLDFKRQTVATCLKKIGGLDVAVNPAVPSNNIYGYRNKLAVPVGTDAEGNTVIGFYAPRSHRIIPLSSCALQRDWSQKVISALRAFMQKQGIAGYDEGTFKGEIRQLVAREVEGKLIITVVSACRTNLEAFAGELDKFFENYTLWLNVNNSRGNVIFGKEWHICRGEGYFYGEDCGVKFKAGPNTFLQINEGVRTLLYEQVVKCASDSEAVAVDLYSGGGMLTAMLAKSCKRAYGIEIVAEASTCAEELRELNNLTGRMFNICGAVEEKLGAVISATSGVRRVIVCDPPRKGMERSVVKAVLNSGAERVILISCNPATLARDMGLLCGSLTERDGQIVKTPGYMGANRGFYTVESVTPYDMFPLTKHVETLVLLRRKEG